MMRNLHALYNNNNNNNDIIRYKSGYFFYIYEYYEMNDFSRSRRRLLNERSFLLPLLYLALYILAELSK